MSRLDQILEADEKKDLSFDAFFKKMKKGNPNMSEEGARKMWDAMKAKDALND